MKFLDQSHLFSAVMKKDLQQSGIQYDSSWCNPQSIRREENAIHLYEYPRRLGILVHRLPHPSATTTTAQALQ
jgi:hypothetical protein